MSEVTADFTHSGITIKGLEKYKERTYEARKTLLEGTGAGNDFLGWLSLPADYDRKEFARIKAAAGKIRGDSEVFVVIGIGGSYLGAHAAIDFLSGTVKHPGVPDIYYTGNNFSTDSLISIIEAIGDRDFSVNVISKSGTTTETAIAFRIFKKRLEDKYGREEAAKRIYATTDAERGALKEMADKEGYTTFTIPDDIGGRFSVLSAVGLLPIAVSGADIDVLMQGAAKMMGICADEDFEDNPALQYAAYRHFMQEQEKRVEVLCIYNPSVGSFSGWWRQLYGESEGKDGKGLFPATVTYSTDLHSVGQFIQDGSRIMFETILYAENSNNRIVIEEDEKNSDGLNYLAGKTLAFVNKCAMQGTAKAHEAGGTPSLLIRYKKKNEFTLGQLFYFFEFACGISGYMLGVNPFDQPGVEFYKKNMFKLLGKPGYED